MKNSKGITLIALVITIIVLLILAGVSLSLVMGQNGTLGQASNAVIKNKCSGVKEKVILALTDAEVDYQVAWTGDTTIERVKTYAESVYKALKNNYKETTDEVVVAGVDNTGKNKTSGNDIPSKWIIGTVNESATPNPTALTFPGATAAPTGYQIMIKNGNEKYWFAVQVINGTGKYKVADEMGYQAGTNKNVEKITLH